MPAASREGFCALLEDVEAALLVCSCGADVPWLCCATLISGWGEMGWEQLAVCPAAARLPAVWGPWAFSPRVLPWGAGNVSAPTSCSLPPFLQDQRSVQLSALY